MGGSIPHIALYVIATGVLGVVAGMLIGAATNKQRINRLIATCRAKLADVAVQRDQFAAEFSRSRSTIESLQTAVANRRNQLQSAVEKSRLLAKSVRTLREEREDTKTKLGTMQNALISVKQQTAALQTEFDKVGEFYKRELAKSLEKRKVLESEVRIVRSEQESFARLVESSVLEHGSPDEMIAAAQLRLGQLDVLQRNVNKLEAENAQLRDDATRMKREYAALEKNVAELDELKIHNQQLVRCVESLENSRKQHENDAERYRDQADQSEQLSDTLRLKLSDLEKNFADMEKQQHQVLKRARQAAVVPTPSAKNSTSKETDDAQDVVDLAKYSNQG